MTDLVLCANVCNNCAYVYSSIDFGTGVCDDLLAAIICARMCWRHAVTGFCERRQLLLRGLSLRIKTPVFALQLQQARVQLLQLVVVSLLFGCFCTAVAVLLLRHRCFDAGQAPAQGTGHAPLHTR